ncbi:MAG: hypothetical protein JWO87_970, partial [Phycisphaerales bacterium]|nr:hypothetical protein [Phycisphaerales bacterium]
MVTSRTQFYIADEEGRDAAALHALQRRKLANLLSEVLATNAFYRAKLSSTRFDPLIDPL